MKSNSLIQVAKEQLELARHTPNSGRASLTIYGGHEHSLRQTVIALLAGHELGEHEGPGEATLQVLHGRVRLTVGSDSWDGNVGDHLALPTNRQAVEAVEDSSVLLTVVKPR